jgi:protein involved in polysaccharide export with SLBB domain
MSKLFHRDPSQSMAISNEVFMQGHALRPFRRTICRALHWANVLLLAGVVTAQSTNYDQRTKAIEEKDSRAQKEADRLVSLSPDKIISILMDEPGLLLEVKKLLVRKAYEQGQLLDPQDLDDDAVYRLIREDRNIQALITREIQDRYYVRAKPNREEREELERNGNVRSNNQNQLTTLQQSQSKIQGQNEEDAYWQRQEQQQSQPNGFTPLPLSPLPSVPNTQPESPQQSPGNGSKQQQNVTQSLPPNVDYVDLLAGFGGQMPRLSPDQMASLMNTSATGPTGASGAGAGAISPVSPSLNSSYGPLFDIPQNNGNEPFQQPNPEDRQRSTAGPSLQRDNHPVIQRRVNPYADVPSLYDLYSQYSGHTPNLERFGEDIFRNGTGNLDQLPMDLPVGPDYVIGPGDGLSIDLWGSVSERLQRVVDREGRVALPEVGTVQVSGRTLGDVQHLTQSVLRTQFRDIQTDVSLTRLRTVRVYVVGDVERPGAYDVSSLSTPLNAVYMAGGPTSRGSLRILRHFRRDQLIEEVDVYDLLLRGVRSNLQRLEPGDTVLVPPLGPEITIEGMVRRPAVYELNGEKSLSEVLELSGGILPTGTLREINVDRLQAHQDRSMLRLDIPETNNQEAINKALDDFKIQDGDKIKISPILPYSDKTVYLEGHVFKPGKYAYRDGMTLTDVVHSYKDLMPEPSQQHAEIVRLEAPDYKPEVIAFNLGDAMDGKQQNIALKPFDTIRIFSRYDFENPPVITVTGEVRDPGDHLSNGATHLRDAIFLAGGTTPDAQLADAQVFRKTQNGGLEVLNVDLKKALDGDADSNVMLQPEDRVFIHKDMTRADPPSVIIQGEVARPGKYPLGQNMTAVSLVLLAGGLKRGAFTETADLTRYEIADGSKMVSEQVSVPIGRALAGDPDTDYRLRDGDVLTIRQLTGWNDVGATIEVKGEVLHPGTFGIENGERLSHILERAGGLRPDAYPYGAILTRVQVREIEEKGRSDLIRRLQNEGAGLKLMPEPDADAKMAKEASLLQWKSTLDQLQNAPPEGRLVIHISSHLKNWVNSPADIQVRAGDVLYIPKRPNFVMINGAVYNATGVTYKPGKSAGYYLRQAGGPTRSADRNAVFVIRADGSVVGGKGDLFHGSVLEVALQPGDMVVVPEKAYGGSTTWRSTLQVAQLVSAVGVAVEVALNF